MLLAGEKVLLTGAGGFIGSHVMEALLGTGAHVRAFIHYNSRNLRGFLDDLTPACAREIEFVQGDLRDAHTVRQAVQGCAVVMHLGASIAIPYSYQSPTDVMQTNVIGTLNVAQAALAAGVSRMVHTSTSEVYGSAQFVPMPETHPLQARSPYAASKIAADKIVESFHCAYQLPVVTVRPFNAFGPRQSMRAVIPTMVQQALFHEQIVLGNTSPTRDYTYVTDTARAFVAAAVSDDAIGEVINAGSGAECSIGEIARMICDIVGRDVPVVQEARRVRPVTSEVDRLYSDSSKALRLMGWRPTVTFAEGLRLTVAWMHDHKQLYRTQDYVL